MAVSLGLSVPVSGEPLLIPESASTNMGQYTDQFGPENVINKSAMGGNYASGVTEFDDFVPTTTTLNSGFPYTTWYSALFVLTGNFDFDLGAEFTIGSLGYWADPGPGDISVGDFRLYASSDAAFTSPTLLGTYSALGNLGNQNYGQVFEFTPVTTRYVRLEILSNYGSATLTGISEVVFELATIPCAADMNGDGILDNGDIGAFINLFLAGDQAADSNGDGILDNGDISTFVGQFLAGC